MKNLLSGTAIFGPVELPPEIAMQRVFNEDVAAEFVNLAPITLQRKRKSGTGPKHVRLSERRIGYRVADLVEWVAAHVAATSDEAQ